MSLTTLLHILSFVLQALETGLRDTPRSAEGWRLLRSPFAEPALSPSTALRAGSAEGLRDASGVVREGEGCEPLPRGASQRCIRKRRIAGSPGARGEGKCPSAS